MPNLKSSQAAAADADCRANQKRRTRQALIDAALALREEGANPSFADVAERALVSRATAYRYFSSVEALISETAAERMVPLEQLWRPGDEPAAAMGRAAAAMMELLLADEVGLHVMERSFMSVWLENEAQARPLRPGRRMKYIAPIVAAMQDTLAPAAQRRLVHALSMVLGSEAALAIRDIGGAAPEEAIDAAQWAAQALVRQALADAAAGAPPARKARK